MNECLKQRDGLRSVRMSYSATWIIPVWVMGVYILLAVCLILIYFRFKQIGFSLKCINGYNFVNALSFTMGCITLTVILVKSCLPENSSTAPVLENVVICFSAMFMILETFLTYQISIHETLKNVSNSNILLNFRCVLNVVHGISICVYVIWSYFGINAPHNLSNNVYKQYEITLCVLCMYAIVLVATLKTFIQVLSSTIRTCNLKEIMPLVCENIENSEVYSNICTVTFL